MLKPLWQIYAQFDRVSEPKRFYLFMLFVNLPIAVAMGAVSMGWYNLFLACALYAVTLLCTRIYWLKMSAKTKKGRS